MTTKQVKMKLASLEQFLEITKNAINQLRNRADFKLVCKLCNIKQYKKRYYCCYGIECSKCSNGKPAVNVAATNETFKIRDTKFYVPVVTLSTENDKNLLEQLRTGFKRTIKWNRSRSDMTNKTKNNNLDYLINPTFKVNRFLVFSFENENDKTSFSKYYVPNVQIKYFYVLIDGKTFFDIPIKHDEETYKQIVEMRRNNDYTTDNVLDYEYFSKHYKLIAIDLKQTN